VPELEALRRRIQTLGDLREIVRSMKALAASHIQQYERAARALAEHTHTVELGFRALLLERSAPGASSTGSSTGAATSTPGSTSPSPASSPTPGPTATASTIAASPKRHRPPCAIVLFGSDRGMCGRFDEAVIEHTAAFVAEEHPGAHPIPTTVVGHRLIERLHDVEGISIEATFPVPSSLHGVVPLVDRLVETVESQRAAGRAERVLLLYHRRGARGLSTPRTERVLPIPDEWFGRLGRLGWPGRGLPAFPPLPREDLLRGLAWSYLFGAFHRAVIDSLESETAARLAAMQAAERNLEDREQELLLAYRRERQATITEELFDVWQGGQAVGRSDA
jgi:F-type H+-transporting ATPase subunit gamma